jgi:diaminohydroxyphosphoribosylaminopyrimidine deaminase / 5-amino-6-(5-phosphoribosylamino)uracil reductase
VISDEYWMGRALEQARMALGRTAPNPSVGAVVVRDGELLGSGYTQPVGKDHAEVVALRDAAERAGDLSGATMYVTLEPCCHVGRTPPCTDAILKAGLHRVVVGVKDMFPAMQGKGLALLKDHGVAVSLGVREQECAELHRGFTRSLVQGLPEVSCKVAMSLDGKIATESGESQWITGTLARQHGHGLRATHDGILVGIGTVLADDPSLTCRVAAASDPRPIVVDTDLRIPATAKVFSHPLRPVIVCAVDAPERVLDADLLRVRRAEHGVDLRAALEGLVSMGLHRILAEGGASVHRSLLDSQLVDTLYVYIAGLLIPGGRSWISGPALEDLRLGRRLPSPTVETLGSDILLQYRLNTVRDGE